ncbi:MAG: hypothetical protein PHY93_00415 [Bacteriovorax sp.]|nr:hypothetical protein [Bacteriovorax sp.]
MKKHLFFVTAIIMAVSSTAFAVSKKSEWSEIRKAKDVSIVQPKFAEAFGPAGLFNACLSNGDIKSIAPVNVCLNYENVTIGTPNSEGGAYTKRHCKKSALQDVTIDKTYTQNICLKRAPATEFSSNECIEWGSKTSIYPDSYLIEIVRRDSLEAGNHLFNKTLVLPMCEYTPTKD